MCTVEEEYAPVRKDDYTYVYTQWDEIPTYTCTCMYIWVPVTMVYTMYG